VFNEPSQGSKKPLLHYSTQQFIFSIHQLNQGIVVLAKTIDRVIRRLKVRGLFVPPLRSPKLNGHVERA
jgi:hypothetical protein